MNISIRGHIKNNFKDSSIDELRESIEESIKSDDEVVLPGMGVLFEILWKNTDHQEDILNTLHNALS